MVLTVARRPRLLISAVAAGVLALACTGGYVGYKAHKNAQFKVAACDVIEQQTTDRGAVINLPGAGTRVAIVGDSYSSGDTLEDYQDAWPFVFARETGDSVALSGVGWTGYVNGGVCDDDQFGTRTSVTDGVDIVIIQGGQNDVKTPDQVRAAALALIKSVDAPRVIIVGPTDAPAVEGEDVVDRELSAAANEAGAEYVSALDWQLAFGPDHGHPSPEGHRQFASHVEDAVSGQARTASTSNNP
jgi:lysophospholipase L1-like esterase